MLVVAVGTVVDGIVAHAADALDTALAVAVGTVVAADVVDPADTALDAAAHAVADHDLNAS